MPQIVHRPAILDDEKRYPFGNVLCKQYPYPESQGESFYDPENPVKDLFVAGCGFVVGDVSKELPHGSILSRNRHPICGSIANYQAPGVFPFGEYVSGIWASLMAGKWHRRGEWRGLLVRDDVDFGGTIHDRCNNLALVVGIS